MLFGSHTLSVRWVFTPGKLSRKKIIVTNVTKGKSLTRLSAHLIETPYGDTYRYLADGFLRWVLPGGLGRMAFL